MQMDRLSDDAGILQVLNADINVLLQTVEIIQVVLVIFPSCQIACAIDETSGFFGDIEGQVSLVLAFRNGNVVVVSVDAVVFGRCSDRFGASGELDGQIVNFITAHQLMLPCVADFTDTIGGNDLSIHVVEVHAFHAVANQVRTFASSNVVQILQDQIQLFRIIRQIGAEYPAAGGKARHIVNRGILASGADRSINLDPFGIRSHLGQRLIIRRLHKLSPGEVHHTHLITVHFFTYGIISGHQSNIGIHSAGGNEILHPYQCVVVRFGGCRVDQIAFRIQHEVVLTNAICAQEGMHVRIAQTGVTEGIINTVAIRILRGERNSNILKLFQRSGNLQAQLVQPILADPQAPITLDDFFSRLVAIEEVQMIIHAQRGIFQYVRIQGHEVGHLFNIILDGQKQILLQEGIELSGRNLHDVRGVAAGYFKIQLALIFTGDHVDLNIRIELFFQNLEDVIALIRLSALRGALVRNNTFVKTSRLYAAVRPMIAKILMIGALHLLMLSLLIAMLSGRLTRPITRIAKQIEEAESPLDLTFGSLINRHNEIGVLTSSLTTMIEKIRLMTQEREESQKQQRLLEIEVLQAQIHPHFMGNTLACIQSLVKEGQLLEAENALVALVKLLNYSIARTDDEVSLGDELRCVEAYVKLRQIRKNYSFDYQVFVPPEQLSQRVPRLFLQPIIENCIVHGFAGLKHRGIITVTGYEKDGKLFLCVDDNGLGETEDRLRDVMNGTMPPSPHSHGIGVSNVFKRLQLRHAEADGCFLEGRAGGGVRVILDLGYFCRN